MGWIAIVLQLFLSLAVAQQGDQGSSLPDDFPKLGFSMNPLYHSMGLRFGHVLSVRRWRPVLRTFEGELMMGLGTNPGRVTDRFCAQNFAGGNQQEADRQCTLFTNPWRFSFLSRALFEHLLTFKDEPVVMYYINYYVAPSHILMRTQNQILNVFSTQPDLKIEKRYQVRSWKAVHPSAGIVTGRVVQASLEFPIRKTYEVIIQESENANNFRAMSVNDARMLRFITRAMLTGKLMRIEYIQLYHVHGRFLSTLFNYMTKFRIVSVEIVD